MGKKYIIELNPDCVEGEYLRIPARIAGEQQWLMTKAALTPCTELDLVQIRKDAYAEGYKEGMQLSIDDAKLKEEYQRGLNDAWDAARKIVTMPDRDFINSDILDLDPGESIFIKYTASEAIEKIRQYEQEQKEIKVGDEVENTQTGVKFIVTHMWENNRGEQGVSGFNYGCSAFSTVLDLVRKTGRHFPEIAAVLEKMRGEQE